MDNTILSPLFTKPYHCRGEDCMLRFSVTIETLSTNRYVVTDVRSLWEVPTSATEKKTLLQLHKIILICKNKEVKLFP
jgi:hypothetical protein